jgi:murein DD-endopeptidase MepM/ murein hydrolase activator NlpD
MFVIRDYKLNAKVRRHRGRGRLRVLAAAGLLATTFGAVRFLDLNTDAGSLISNAEAAAPLTSNLAIPGKTGEKGTYADPAAAARELPVQQDPQPGLQVTNPEIPEAAVADPVAQTAAQDNPDRDAPSLLAEIGLDHQPDPDSPQLADEPGILDTAVVLTHDLVGTGVTEDELVLAAVEQAPQWTEHEIARGESLARIFDSQGLDASLLHRIVNSGKQAKSLANVRPGQKLRFQFDDNHELTGLELQRNRVECLRISIADDEIKTETISKEVDTQVASAAGVIESSLFMDGQKAGLSDGLIMELATIFGWDIDFALEIRAGDQFRVLYEEQYLDGEKLRDGPILAAEFTNRGTAYTAVRYEDRNGEIGYFDADGHSKRRAFIRSPIKFARVSSRYNPKRWHPVLKKWRSHKGVDYAAPRGTAVRATGDGRVIYRGNKGGYGRTVIVEHASKYTTLYAHLSKYSKRAKSGSRVKQGQVIGYVGKSGLATGPHLHYEFRVHGRHHDPLRVKLPKSLSLPKSEIANFRQTTTPLLTQLAAIPADTMIASAGVTETP